MSRSLMIAAILFCCAAVAVTVAGSSGRDSGSGDVAADGLIQFDPPQARGCIAVCVDVPADKMIVGMRWFNGTATTQLPKILASTGSNFSPPAYDQAVLVAENLQGQDQAWSVARFESPVASQSGTLFLIVEYPAEYTTPVEGRALGVGYARERAMYPYFVSGNGDNWIKVSSKCRVLLEPILADRIPGVVVLGGMEKRSSDIPKTKYGLYAGPNPFNPQTNIALYLKQADSGDVRIYDIRGRLVMELYKGILAQGENSFVWNGRDSAGRGVASGAYWVQARTTDQSHTIKVLLLK